jgi:N-acetylglucosaminyl-diphospho-decaprenol L-rhamnosyltransferase
MSPSKYSGAHVAVITVTYSSGPTLLDFVESVSSATKRSYRVFISDNGSTDGYPEQAIERWPETVLHDNNANLGYGTAINRVASELDDAFEWIVVCNPDTRLTPGSIDALIDFGEANATVGAIGPQILDEDGAIYPSARRLPSLRTGIGHALFGLPWPDNPWTKVYHSPGEPGPDGSQFAGWLSGACVVVRRSAFDAIAGFDEKFFMYFEDVDLGRRLGDAGWQRCYLPTTSVTHIGGVSTRSHAAVMIVAHHESAYRYLAITHPGPLLAPLRLVLRVGLRVRSWRMRHA